MKNTAIPAFIALESSEVRVGSNHSKGNCAVKGEVQDPGETNSIGTSAGLIGKDERTGRL